MSNSVNYESFLSSDEEIARRRRDGQHNANISDTKAKIRQSFAGVGKIRATLLSSSKKAEASPQKKANAK